MNSSEEVSISEPASTGVSVALSRLRLGRYRWLAILTVVLTVSGVGAFAAVQAQGQICRDVGNLNVCGDILVAEAGTEFHLRGNIKIGPKGGAKVVHLTDMPGNFDGLPIAENTFRSQYIHRDAPDPNSGTTDFVTGEAKFINDATGLALMSTSYVRDPDDTNNVVVGRFFVDTTNRRIFLPAPGAVPVFNQKNIKRNANYHLGFVSQAGALNFYRNGGSVDELSLVTGEFDLNTKKFKATLPVDIKLDDVVENSDLRLTMRFEWTEERQFSGTVDGFKLRLAGLLMDVAGLTVKAAQGSTPAEFTAATVQVLKNDNPGVPNLDPTNANLIFAFTNLTYRNGIWYIGGVEVPIRDWEFGGAFKMVNQRLGLISEGGVQAFQIKSTMKFPKRDLPVVLKIGRAQAGNGAFKPVFQAGLTNFKPTVGIFDANLTNAVFVGDPAQNFWGIQAQTAALQWPAFLGGRTAAGVSNFKLGMNNERKLQFALGAGTVGLPDFESGVLKGALSGTVSVVEEVITFQLNGVFNLKIQGNSGAGINANMIIRHGEGVAESTTAQSVQSAYAAGIQRICRNAAGAIIACPTGGTPAPTGLKPFELNLAGFSLKLAGFTLTLTNPRGLDDGGFAADGVGFALPTGLIGNGSPGSTGATIQSFVMSGAGNVTIGGGSFEVAPITIAGYNFVGLRGTFVKLSGGGYEFAAGGKFPLPGIEPGSSSPGISAEVRIKLKPDNSLDGLGVSVTFEAGAAGGIPIGTTGMALTKIGGSFDIKTGTATIAVTMRASSTFRILTIPIVSVDGGATVVTNPFTFGLNAQLSVLIFEIANASVNMGAGQGFDGGNGLNTAVNVNTPILDGEFRMRVGKGIAGDPNKRRFAASASWIVGIKKGEFGTLLPPFDLGGAVITLSGGAFKDTQNNNQEVVGVRGSRCKNICIGFFINLGRTIGNGFFDFTNIDAYQLIPAAAVRAAAAQGRLGFVSRAMTVAEAQELGLVLAAGQIQGAQGILQETIPVVVTQTGTLLAGIEYPAGTPGLRLRLPDNSEITPNTVNSTTTFFVQATSVVSDTSSTSAYFVVKNAAPGNYTLILDNAPAEYEEVSYLLNEAPSLTLDSASCGGPDVTGVTVSCADGLVAAAAPNASTATVNWTASDGDSPNARVSVGYAPDRGDPASVEFTTISVRVEDQPLGAGSATIDLSEVGTGKYRLVVVVDDDVNPPVVQATNLVIDVTDARPPAIPAGLSAVSQAGELLVKWAQNSESDLAGYEIGFGVVAAGQSDDPSRFVYTRNMGPKVVITGTDKIVDAKLWGLDDDTEVFYGLRAYDNSGNFSEWTPLQRATPWALSPEAWSPTPNGAGVDRVEIAFATALEIDTLEDALTLKNSTGQPIPGVLYFITGNDDATVIGVGIEPTVRIEGPVTATLKGGPNGVTAVDGRQMSADYVWSFSLEAGSTLYLPLVTR